MENIKPIPIGRKCKSIHFGTNGEECYTASTNTEIITEQSFHGEYDIIWCVVYFCGVEISRVNAKFIETIVWEIENENTQTKKE